MFTSSEIPRVVVALAIAFMASATIGALARAQGDEKFGFGTAVTEQDLAGYVSPLPDGRGLPKGSGDVPTGRLLYEQHCAACHGINLEGGLADKLVGGRGTLVNNDPKKAPVKTVESYWPYATTLFDYIKRAMPFTAPGSLSNDEVYALSAFILAKANIVAADAVLDQKTLAAVKMPNQGGFVPDLRGKGGKGSLAK